jgi:N-acylglucosamine-6-phosphate 2-epimerase
MRNPLHSLKQTAAHAHVLHAIRCGLVVSCQPVEDGPFDAHDAVLRYAKAAVIGGAKGLRIEGAARLRYLRSAIDIPIIGIVKRDLADWPVRITPFLDDVRALADAGADIIAVDATLRARPFRVDELLTEIHTLGCIAMADCSNDDDAAAASAMGFELIGTTLSGYTGLPSDVPVPPDFALLERLTKRGLRVMAEGRFNTPEQAARAIALGAWSVTVGTAITRAEVVTEWFSDAIVAAQHSSTSTETKQNSELV